MRYALYSVTPVDIPYQQQQRLWCGYSRNARWLSPDLRCLLQKLHRGHRDTNQVRTSEKDSEPCLKTLETISRKDRFLVDQILLQCRNDLRLGYVHGPDNAETVKLEFIRPYELGQDLDVCDVLGNKSLKLDNLHIEKFDEMTVIQLKLPAISDHFSPTHWFLIQTHNQSVL